MLKMGKSSICGSVSYIDGKGSITPDRGQE